MMGDSAVASDADPCYSTINFKAEFSNWQEHPDSIDLDQTR